MQSRGTAKQLGRVKHVRGAEFVHVYLQARILADERASGRSVIQMNVCEQYGVETGKLKPAVRVVAGACPGWKPVPGSISALVMRADEERRGNRTRMAGPLKINRDREVHGELSLTHAPKSKSRNNAATVDTPAHVQDVGPVDRQEVLAE